VDDGNEMLRVVELRQRLETMGFSFAAIGTHAADGGLFRPAFSCLKLIEYGLFGFDAWKHHLAHLVILLVLCQLLFSIVHRGTLSDGAAWLSGLMWVFFSPDVENWYRLNEASSFYPLAFALPSLWCVVRAFSTASERVVLRWTLIVLSGVLLVPATFTRETSVAFAGFAAALVIGCLLGIEPLLTRRNLALAVGHLAAHLAVALAWYVLKQMTGVQPISAGGYTSDYQLSAGVFIATAFKYADVVWNGYQLLFPIALVLIGQRLWSWARGRRVLDSWDGWALVGLCWFAAVLAILLPWKHPIARYLGSGVPGLALFVGVTLWRFLSESASNRSGARLPGTQWVRWVVIANLAILPAISLVRNYNYLIFRHDYDLAGFQVVGTVAKEAPPHARLFMNMPADSQFIFNEMMKLLRILHGRADLAQVNFNATGRPEPRRGDFLLVYVREPATPRSTEASLPESFHAATLERLKDRLSFVSRFRYERQLLNSYPDAPVFNLVTRLGIQLPDYLGMKPEHRRALFMREPSLVEWRIYRFEM